MLNLEFLPGSPSPLGATPYESGVNFAIFSRNATAINIDFFENEDDNLAFESYSFDRKKNKTGDIWHVFVKNLKPNSLYLYRVDGPFAPIEGHRFNPHNYILDPYAKGVTNSSISLDEGLQTPPPNIDGDLFFSTHTCARYFPKCVVIDDEEFDWQGDKPLNHPINKTIIYEAHVKGLTYAKPDLKYNGTYKGIIEIIPYLKELGITSLELLPVQEFDENENTRTNPRTGEKLKNYWGYSTIAFFAPKVRYAHDKYRSGPINEFKEMVRELHKAGIEVILDIVFNHTAEGNGFGPTYSFKGLDNSIYYILENEKRYYKNFSGCGNTVNSSHPVVQNFIMDCLHYWVVDMHVDGFRFDLASILGRDKQGNLMENAPTIERICEDPILQNTKIIAEAWDAGDAYQVGAFPGRWAEWNDRFRNDVRLFWRGDIANFQKFATRITGSSDIYASAGRKPTSSVNFVTSHDGFTLYDLLSYNEKHNEENGENNTDGDNNNYSFNHGFEGKTENPEIEAIRFQKAKNLMLTLLLSIGTPMISMGDEVLRTQGGNNNPYCQDNEVSWFNWNFSKKQRDFLNFITKLINFRKRHPVFMRSEFFTGAKVKDSVSDIEWYNVEGKYPDWTKSCHFIACFLNGLAATQLSEQDANDFYLMINSSSQDVTATIPLPHCKKTWHRLVDTSIVGEKSFLLETDAQKLKTNKYVVLANSFVVLINK
ncbi:MAG: glycogen debranching protein GlgX [Treponemataceae bacterium]